MLAIFIGLPLYGIIAAKSGDRWRRGKIPAQPGGWKPPARRAHRKCGIITAGNGTAGGEGRIPAQPGGWKAACATCPPQVW